MAKKLTIQNLMLFKKWQEEGNRQVEIKFGAPNDKRAIGIFVYDYDLGTGQLVDTPDQIDLLGKKREQFEQLQLELEGLEV